MNVRHKFFRFVMFVVSIVVARPTVSVAQKKSRTIISNEREVAAQVDRLKAEAIPASPLADDAEFLRRVTLDLTGCIPTFDEVVEFLESDDADKRSRWIDKLLRRESYGTHFASIWRELIEPRDTGSTKGGRDTFSPWLAQHFNRDRGWNQIVTGLLIVEGKIREQPQSRFILANSVDFEPQPNLLADATARLFWGVQLRCAECHDHPFAPWKQTDFWSTAAFFSRLRKGYTDGKNPQGWTLTETKPDEPISRKFTKLMAAPNAAGPAIVVPDAGGKLAEVVVKAKFLGGEQPNWSDDGPFRERFAEWATSKGNPYFAANAVNRLWAHLFARGLVNPLDEFHENNPPSHPELLKLLADEFIDSDFDMKHLLRVICNSRTYQRTSRPLPKNKADELLFSHMAVKVMSPGMLYDSLSVVLYPVAPKPGANEEPAAHRINPLPSVSRNEFVKFFAARPDENTASVVNQGIPQFLRLMNGPTLHGKLPGLNRFLNNGESESKKIESLYLAAYARKPSDDEVKLMVDYIRDYSNPRQSLSGVLWALLNSGEFALDH
jgi:hypothetical protein